MSRLGRARHRERLLEQVEDELAATLVANRLVGSKGRRLIHAEVNAVFAAPTSMVSPLPPTSAEQPLEGNSSSN